MQNTEASTFGTLLRRLRKAAGLSQEELAEHAGLSVRGIGDLERGVSQAPYRATVQQLAEALELSSSERAALMTAARRRPAARSLLPPHSILVPPTPLVGREREVEEVRALLERPGVRLVTLTGPGGVGKTRVALEVVTYAGALPNGGVRVVPLAPLRDPTLLAPTIARTLGLRDIAGQSAIESLTEYLRERELIVLLDNFEHLLEAAGIVAQLLPTCPGLKVLVTSRAALRVQGEQEYPIQPLSVPDARYLPPVPALARYPAVEVFVQRARAVQPDFSISAANAGTVAEICARLDGLPLALELAAARIKLFPPREMLARLTGESSLVILTGGPQDLPPRLQTMRNAIAWSCDLLAPAAQVLFRRLAVCVGGCTLRAAEAVCPIHGDLEDAVLDGLADLVDQSLVRPEEQPDGDARIVMLETIRDYALERLEGSGELAVLQRQHAEFLLTLAEEAEPRLLSKERRRWLEHLEREHGNLRAALEWCRSESSATESWLRLAAAMGWFCFHRGHVNEGRQWIEGALARTKPSERTPERAKALVAGGGLAWAQGDYAIAQSWLEEGVDILRQTGKGWLYPGALTFFGMTALVRDDLESAHRAFTESIVLAHERGDTWTEAYTRYELGNVMLRSGSDEAARSNYEQGLRLFRALEDPWGISIILFALGELARAGCHYANADALYEECVSILRAEGERWTLVDALAASADVAIHAGDVDRARALYSESLTLGRELSNRFGTLVCLVGTAGIAEAEGQPERAVQLLAAADTLLKNTGARLGPADRSAYELCLAAAQGQLDKTAFKAAWTAGQDMGLDQMVAYALEGISEVLPAFHGASGTS